MTPARRLAAALVLLACPAARADPVVVEMPDRAAARTTLVTVGDVARVTGGTPADRARVAALDLAEVKARDAGLTLTRRGVEFRLKLAGLDPDAAAVTGADRTAVVIARRAVTAEEVAAAARAELLRRVPWPPDTVVADLAVPIAVRLPEIPAGERLEVSVRPHAPITRPGRVQMDVTLSAGGEPLLALAVQFEARVAGGSPALPAAAGALPPPAAFPVPAASLPAIPPVPAAATPPPAAPPLPTGPAVVRARQPVVITARSGALVVTAAGEAQQDGRAGEVIRVENVDSKKVLRARVTGPGAVDIELGGVP